MRFPRLAACLALLLAASTALVAEQIRGDYLETRSADVYTGQCFANGEMGLVGNQAILAWRVQKGSWNGIRLDGLTVVAAVKARATLGDPYENPYPAKAVLIVDRQADDAQRAALSDFARQMGGELLAHVEHVVSAPIELQVRHDGDQHGTAWLRAGDLAQVQTRSIGGNDHICGNEVTFYPPLTPVAHSMPAVALTDEYRGPGLGVSWTSHGKRSAFVGSFAR